MKVLNDLDLVHGNLNSSSVFVHQGYKAAIVKFTNFYYSTHFSALTNFGDAIPMHILAYISPETLKDKKYNEKTEIWSLGMLYYEMLYGVKPWSGNTREELICNIY
jgi:serine/threonine protein kinase